MPARSCGVAYTEWFITQSLRSKRMYFCVSGDVLPQQRMNVSCGTGTR